MLQPDSVEIAVETLEERALGLLEEQAKLRFNMVKEAFRDIQISRDIHGCMAGANALGYVLELPPRPAPGSEPAEIKAFLAARSQLTPLFAYFKTLAPAELSEKLTAPTPQVQNSVSSLPLAMPRVADVVMDRLRVAGSKGAKAAEIRDYIEETYRAEIHEKTVGMTLYRLQKNGEVRRDGHYWFLPSQEERNPDVPASGSMQSSS